MTITGTAIAPNRGALNQSVGRDQHHDEGSSLGKQRRKVRTHLSNGDAQLDETSALAR
jgi:hypothetical protein